MSKEIAHSSILYLKAKALESYGIIKDLLKQAPETGATEKIAQQAIVLARLEGAMITMQQYFGEGLPSESEKEEEAEEPGESLVITEDRSPTLKRALKKQKILEVSKRDARKRKQNEEG
jgi:hypothetical protein